MYGFKKVPDLQQGVMNSDGRTEHHQFAHEHFLRGQPNLLAYIDRKKGSHTKAQPQAAITFDTPPALPPPSTVGQLDMHTIISGIAAIRRHQTAISTELTELKQSNRALWQESMEARARHQKQQDTINRIVKFLAGVFGHQSPSGSKDGDITGNSHPPMQMPLSRLMIEGKKDPQKQKVGIVEVEDEDSNSLFTRDTSPLTNSTSIDHLTVKLIYFAAQFMSVETPASTAEPSSPAMTDASAFPVTPSVENPADMVSSQTSTDPIRAVSPGRLSPRIDLSAFSPSDLSQFLASLIVPSMNDSSNGNDGTVAPYQAFDFGSYSPPPLALPSPKSPTTNVNADELLSFPQDMQNQWKQTADIDKDVKESNDGIATLLDTFKSCGIDPSQFEENPMLHSVPPGNTESAAADDTSFFDSFLNTFPPVPTPDALAEEDSTEVDPTAFLDDVHSPTVMPTVAPAEPVELSNLGGASESPPLKSARGRKRKSDVAVSAKLSEPTLAGRPKRRKER